MSSLFNSNLTKWQVGETKSWQNGNLMKWQVYKTAILQNRWVEKTVNWQIWKFIKHQFDEMES